MAKPTSAILAAKIAELERTLAKAIPAFQAAKDALASAYAESLDTAAPSKALAAARDNVEALQAALAGLDEQHYAAATAEYSAAVAALTSERDKAFQEIGGEIDAALKPAIVVIGKYLPSAREILAAALDSATSEIWVALSEKHTAAVLALGPAPKKALSRAIG